MAGAGEAGPFTAGVDVVTPDPVLRTLTALDAVLANNLELTVEMRRRIGGIRAARGRGLSYAEIAAAEPRPALVELLAQTARALDDAGAHVRRTEARTLYEEGLTMDEIAASFGVTRQRVSTLLREFPLPDAE
jgi:DNA-directed RNA polymerase sigma subunit (sigma70/sigma32)